VRNLTSAIAFAVLATPVLAEGELICQYNGVGAYFGTDQDDPELPIGQVLVTNRNAIDRDYAEAFVFVIGQGDWTGPIDCPSAVSRANSQSRVYVPERPFSAMPQPDPSRNPLHGTFDIDPDTIHGGHVVHEVELYSGGVLQSRGAVPGVGCDVGQIGTGPELRVNYTHHTDFSILRFQILNEMGVALAVRKPDGEWLCGHQYVNHSTMFHHYQSSVQVSMIAHAQGHYDVWVGTLPDSAGNIPVTLQVYMN
jgi:hypothetical protein